MLKTSRPLAVAALATAALVAHRLRPDRRGRRRTPAPTRRPSPSPRRRPPTSAPPTRWRRVADGTLTIATDDPAYEPWFVDDDPTNGEGYESAVAYAIAEQLGYTADQVTWVTVPFNKVVQPGPEGLRLRRQPGLHHRGPPQGRRLLVRLLRRRPDRHHQQGQRRSTAPPASPTSPTPSSAPRSARRATPRSPTRSSPRRTRRSSTPTTRPSRRSRTARSTASSSTCPPPTS